MARILVIDDERLVRASIRAILRREGHEIEEAGDGIAGVSAAEAADFDIAIVDIIMPIRDGIETMRLLRDRYPELRLIAMSGGGRVDSTELLDKAREIGVAATLLKPFHIRDLVTTVADVLASHEQSVC